MSINIAFVVGLSDAKALQKIAPLQSLPQVVRIDIFRRLPLQGVKLFWLQIPRMFRKSVLLAELSRICLLFITAHRYDVIIGCHFKYHCLWAYLASRLWRKPLIQLITSDVNIECANYFFRRAILNANACGVRGPVSAKMLRRLGYNKRIAVINNAYSIHSEKEEHSENILYDLVVVSHYFSYAKDFPWMMEVLHEVNKQYAPFRVAMVGSQLQEKLHNQIIKYSLGNVLYFFGYKSQSEISDVYNQSRALLLTSRYEGLPMAIIEAMAHGLPCFATRVGDIPWLVREGIEGKLVDHGDTQTLVSTIVNALQNPGEITKMGKNARNRHNALMPRFEISAIASAWNILLNAAVH